MKNVFISFIIFISMLFSILFSVKYLNQVYSNINSLNLQLENHIVTEDWENSYKLIQSIDINWSDYSRKLFMFVNHQEIDSISSELKKLSQYILCENKDESLASLHSINFFLKHIVHLEEISIENIL
ncbi:DUF4363 family protein [Clostridium cochlearium]|uniref:DUF4363 family protein n=1 Tax=Clostridium cochlearium TaxID=1494 RepID=A0A239Z2T2_CLOCO|nr:DUF4363 family protein [Clostridium cochlearium]MBU5270565.1 DUF4363 family protein [Clostridium cochlearium]MCG4572827.1 DUF4363 family protein [Clostridium cochlearium]MCG4579988.1 DUF4363 family protein [Clostridium cochlearium]MCR1972452.1 DUF4363 family protein [Clostridium cochlearium]MDU1443189.1 DUF4363 family protein [Clostridium cochlearium]